VIERLHQSPVQREEPHEIASQVIVGWESDGSLRVFGPLVGLVAGGGRAVSPLAKKL
jgi:hypothetical protein